jgi:hypothetical protein
MFIITLLATPSLSLIDLAIENQSCSTSCCTSSAQDQSDENNENGCNNVCNPFLSCGSCIGFISPSSSLLRQQLVFIKPTINIAQEFPLAQFTHSIWHPPKFS